MSEEIKRVKASDDIIFEEAGITIPKGTVFMIESLNNMGIILYTEEGDRYMIDLVTFENGFEIAG